MSRASTLAKAVGANGDIATTGSTTLGDASTDTVTFNAATASIPNGLNFSNGSVGVGVVPSSASLHVKGNWVSGHSSVKSQTITAISSGGVAGYGMFDSDGTRAAYVSADNTAFNISGQYARPMYLSTNNVYRAQISSGGRFEFTTAGAFTSTPITNFHIKADWIGGYGAVGIQAVTAGASTGVAFFSSGGTRLGYVNVDSNAGNMAVGNNSSAPLIFETANTERGRFESNGHFYMPTNGGIIYGKAPGAYAAISDLGWTAPFQAQEKDTGTTANRYIPIISGTSLSSSGYRQHTLFGSYRGGEWNSAIIAVGGNDNYPTRAFYFSVNGNFAADGTIYGASKSFKIPHPLPELEETHDLVHISIEAPRADLVYRGKVALVNGTAEVNIDVASGMTDGTFVALCREVQCFTSNESGWNHVRGVVTGNVLSIECQDATATDTISWMVVGERQDKHMYETAGTDENANLIVEPLREIAPEVDPDYVLSPAPNQNDVSASSTVE